MKEQVRSKITALLLCVALIVSSAMPVMTVRASEACWMCNRGGSMEYTSNTIVQQHKYKIGTACTHNPPMLTHSVCEIQTLYQRIYTCTAKCGHTIYADVFWSTTTRCE